MWQINRRLGTIVLSVLCTAGCSQTSSYTLELSKFLNEQGHFSYPGLRLGATVEETEKILGYSLGDSVKGEDNAYGVDGLTMLYYFPEGQPMTIAGNSAGVNLTFAGDKLQNITYGMAFSEDQYSEIEKILNELTESYGDPTMSDTREITRENMPIGIIEDKRWLREGDNFYTALIYTVVHEDSKKHPYSVALALSYNEWTDIDQQPY